MAEETIPVCSCPVLEGLHDAHLCETESGEDLDPSSLNYETRDYCDGCNGFEHSNLKPKTLGIMHHARGRTGMISPVLFIGYCCCAKKGTA